MDKPYRLTMLAFRVTAVAFPVFVCSSLGYGQAPPTGAADNRQPTTQALQKRIEELERKNQELEAKNQELADQIADFTEGEEPEPVDIRHIPDEGDAYRFLSLGTKKDYLKAERFRIADQIESFIPPLFEPVRPFHAYTLPPGAWRISLRAKAFRNENDFGRDSRHANLFSNTTVRSLESVLSIQYGFELPKFPDATLAVSIPYRAVDVSGQGQPSLFSPATISMDGGGQGIGDITVVLKKKWFDQGNIGFNFATFTGLILPTGKDDVEFDAAQTRRPFRFAAGMPVGIPLNLFGRNPRDRSLPPGLQPGQGAFGVRIGAAVTRQFERAALHAGVILDHFLENDDIVPGDELKYGVSYVFPPLNSDILAIDLSVFGRYKWDSEFPGSGILGRREDFKYGNVLFFSPSVILTPNPQMRFFVSPEIRILEPNRGPAPEFALMAGMTLTF